LSLVGGCQRRDFARGGGWAASGEEDGVPGCRKGRLFGANRGDLGRGLVVGESGTIPYIGSVGQARKLPWYVGKRSWSQTL